MTHRLEKVGDKFDATYKTIYGRPFRGQILQPPDTSRVSNFLSARRYLRTKPVTIVKPRDVIVVNEAKYIVAEHGDGFYREPIYKHFKLFEVDYTDTWYPKTEITDSLTGIKSVSRETSRGIIYMSTQPHSSLQDQVAIPQVMKTAITNAPVQVDDKIGDYVVTKVDLVLGISLLEMKVA